MKLREMSTTGEDEEFTAWRDAHLHTLRWLFNQLREHNPERPYQSFPDFCRAEWEHSPKSYEAFSA